jgi:hypothetical protein
LLRQLSPMMDQALTSTEESMIRKSTRMAAGLALVLILVAAVAEAGPQPVQLIVSDDNAIEIAVSASSLVMETVPTDHGSFTSVEVPGFGFTNEVGSPRLPALRSMIEVPLGAEWTVTVENPVFREVRVAAPALPLQPPQPKTGPAPTFAYDAAAYGRGGFGDAPLASLSDAGMVRGHRVAELAVSPAAYDATTRTVRVLESATVRITLRGSDAVATQEMHARYASDAFDRVLYRALLNGGQSREPYMPGGEIGLLVISTPAFYGNSELASFLAWKSQKGFHVTHVSTALTGATKEQIKAYIQNAYDNWTIPPTFVIFVGDTPDIPHWVGIGVDNPATDLNYAMLAGSDYLPDVEIGRISVTSPAELHNALAKTLSFERVSWSGNDDWEKHATFLASEDNYAVSEGTHNFVISTYLQPLGYTSDKLYCHTYHATTAQVSAAFNAGRSQGTYSGHGAETYWADGPVFYQSDVRALTNTVYPFVQAYTCLSNCFTVGECFGETWLRAEHGAVAYYGSSVTSYWTEDDILEKKVYQGFYDDQNVGDPVDQTWIGGMWLYGKLKFYDYFGNTSTVRRYFEMYNMMGDVTIDVWTAIPSIPSVSVPQSLLAGQTSFSVTVVGVPYAMISAQKSDAGNSIFVTAWTGANGQATVNLPEPLTPGTVNLSVTAHNQRPYSTTIQVIQPTGPYLVYESHRIADNGDDGLVDAGEMVGLYLTLKNIGRDVATGVSATLGSNDPYVNAITANEPGIPDIPPAGTGETRTCWGVSFSSDTPDQHPATFGFGTHSNEGDWGGNFTVIVNAPVLSAASYLIDDSAPGGNGNGTVDPGETFYLQLWLKNSGHGKTRTLTGTMSTANPFVVLHHDTGWCPSIPPGGDGLIGSYQIELRPGCPTPSTIPLHVALDAPGGCTAAVDFDLSVGAFVDDVEVDRGWTCGAVGDDATTGLWVRVDPNGTTYGTPPQQVQPEDDHTADPGHICFVTGNGSVGGAAGEQDLDGGKTTLLTPVFDLHNALSATISYWRWYTNNLGNNPNEDYWDVDVTADGTNWVHLEHTTASANSWNQFTFDLGSFVALTDHVQIRFVAQDYNLNSLLEAAVDDFSMSVVRSPSTGAPGIDWRPGVTGLIGCQPNPFNPRATILWEVARETPALIRIYDVTGRMVRALFNGRAAAGPHASVFDGRDTGGKALPSGIYFVRMETPGVRQIRQVTLLK